MTIEYALIAAGCIVFVAVAYIFGGDLWVHAIHAAAVQLQSPRGVI